MSPQVSMDPQNFLVAAIKTLQDQMRDMSTQQSFTIVDSNQQVRVQGGILPSGDFGLAVSDVFGNTTEFLPSYSSFYSGSLTTSSTTAVSLPNSPSVAAIIGASGDCDIDISSLIVVTNDTATCNLLVDGAPIGQVLSLTNNNAGSIACNSAQFIRYSAWTGTVLTPGLHTFSTTYQSGTGSLVTFNNSSLRIAPI